MAGIVGGACLATTNWFCNCTTIFLNSPSRLRCSSYCWDCWSIVFINCRFKSSALDICIVTFFPHIQGFKCNQGSHVILVALICSINIEPFRKNHESEKLNLAPGLRVTSNSATLKFTREEPPSGLLTLRMPEPTVDPTNY